MALTAFFFLWPRFYIVLPKYYHSSHACSSFSHFRSCRNGHSLIMSSLENIKMRCTLSYPSHFIIPCWHLLVQVLPATMRTTVVCAACSAHGPWIGSWAIFEFGLTMFQLVWGIPMLISNISTPLLLFCRCNFIVYLSVDRRADSGKGSYGGYSINDICQLGPTFFKWKKKNVRTGDGKGEKYTLLWIIFRKFYIYSLILIGES